MNIGNTGKRLYKIGEVADYFQLSVQTLRLYEKNGLFVPAVVNEDTGYRYYEYTQFENLRLIVLLKNIGLPLKTIGNLVNMPKSEEYVQTLIQCRDMLERKICEDIAKKQYLDDKIESVRVARKMPQNKVMLLYFPEQQIVRYDKTIIGGLNHEVAILEFMNFCQLSPGFGRIGQLFDPEHLVDQDEMVSISMFVREEICSYMPPDKADVIYRDVIPEGIYATMYYQKRTEDSIPFVYELLDEVKRYSFEAIGEVVRTIVFDIGTCEYEESGYLACIRILVKRLG